MDQRPGIVDPDSFERFRQRLGEVKRIEFETGNAQELFLFEFHDQASQPKSERTGIVLRTECGMS